MIPAILLAKRHEWVLAGIDQFNHFRYAYGLAADYVVLNSKSNERTLNFYS